MCLKVLHSHHALLWLNIDLAVEHYCLKEARGLLYIKRQRTDIVRSLPVYFI